jgi:hypothetical protein
LKKIIEASLEGELDDHLQQTRKSARNRRNGHAQKIFRARRLAALKFFRQATVTRHLIHKLSASEKE